MSIKRAVKFVISIVLMIGLVVYVGGSEVLNVFLSLDWFYIALLVLMSWVLIYVSCLKWQLFIKHQNKQVSVFYLMRLYTIAYFFNIFAPSSLGGDALRSYKLGKFLGSQADAFAATFLERVTGVIAMCSMGLLALLFGAASGFKLLLFIICIPVLIFTLSCFIPAARSLLFVQTRKIVPIKLISIYDKIEVATAYASGNKQLLFYALLYSLLFHFLAVVNTYIACAAVGWTEVNIFDLFVVLPLILILGSLPLTPNGMGLQEGAFMFFLKSIGAASSIGLSVGLLLRAKVILLAIVGGILYMLPDKKS